MQNGNKKQKIKVAIIGGGVSGVTAALSLPETFEVSIFERENRLLKKLLKTGNGKANIFNTYIREDSYNDPAFINHHPQMLELVQKFYGDNGIMTYIDEVGRGYPFSRSAKTLAQNLLKGLKSHVKVFLEKEVKTIKKTEKGYLIFDEVYDEVILTTGSSAYFPNLNVFNDNENLFESLNISLSPFYPTSGPLLIKENLKLIENEKVQAELSLFHQNRLVTKETGEILFKRDSLSGIASFIVSSRLTWDYAKRGLKGYRVALNLIKGQEEAITKLLNYRPCDASILEGVFSENLNQYVLSRLKHRFDKKTLIDLLSHLEFKITDDFILTNDKGQLMSGGVRIDGLNAHTFKSIDNSHLHFGGEVLDIDGVSGGYNLMFATYTGLVIAKDLVDTYC